MLLVLQVWSCIIFNKIFFFFWIGSVGICSSVEMFHSISGSFDLQVAPDLKRKSQGMAKIFGFFCLTS